MPAGRLVIPWPEEMVTGPRAHGLVSSLFIGGLVVLVGVTPVLPTVGHKVDATLLAGVILLVGLYLWVRLASGAGRTPLDLPVLGLILAAGLATVLSVDRSASFFPSSLRGEGWLVYAAYGIAALAAARLDARGARTVIAAALIGGTAVGILAGLQYYAVPVDRLLRIDTPPPHFGRAYATLGNALFLGGYALLLLPVASSLAVTSQGRARWLASVTAVGVSVALLTAQARAAWVAVTIAVGLLAALLLRRADVSRHKLMVLAATILVVSVVIVVTRPSPRLAARATATFRLQDPSLGQRVYVWKHTLPLIAQRPLFGWGFGALLGRFPDAGSPEWQRIFGFSVVGIDTPHNEILHFAYSLGLVGLAAYLWVWLVVVRSLFVALRAPVSENSTLAAGLLAAMAGYALWLQLAWSHMGLTNVFWPLTGIAVALARATRTGSGEHATMAGDRQ